MIKSKNIIRIALGTGFLLLIPLIAMQFTSEVNWNLLDFVVMGILLFSTGVTYELVVKRISNETLRITASILLVAAFLLVWVTGAIF